MAVFLVNEINQWQAFGRHCYITARKNLSLNEYQMLYREFFGPTLSSSLSIDALSTPLSLGALSTPLPIDALSTPLPIKESVAEFFPADCGLTNIDPSIGIVGGEVSSAAAWPWQVVVMSSRRMCGGVLVSDHWVLTAAHCMSPNVVIYAGLQKIDAHLPIQKGTKVSRAVTHPMYAQTNDTVTNDLALLKLSRQLEISEQVRPACLPSLDKDFTENPFCFVTGFGDIVSFNGSVQSSRLKILKKLKVEIVFHRHCKYLMKLIKYVIKDGHLCVKSLTGGSPCRGDSGGPLSCKVKGRYYVAGVTSFGIDRCLGVMPMVFTRVSYYKAWIEQELWQT